MANIHTFTENIKVDVAMNQATLNNAENAEIWFSMQNYDLSVFLVFFGALAGTSAGTIQMRERNATTAAEGNLGTGEVFADTESNTVRVLQARGEELSVNTGYTEVGILIDNTIAVAAVVGCILLRMRARYKQVTLPA